MNYTMLEAQIEHGLVTVKEPEKLPEMGYGLLIVLPAEAARGEPTGVRVKLPLIRGDGQRPIDPTAEDLDASLWD